MEGQWPQRSAKRRQVDGVILVDKPLQMSSNAALQRVKRALRARKAGHTGTLDPLATGLLPICLGEATKFSQGLLDSDKTYRTRVMLGIVTETGDREGRVVIERSVDIHRSDIDNVLARFRGPIEQIPHRYSALKRDGRRLYEYARTGESPAIPPRPVRIHEIDVEDWSPPCITLRVRCSKGTYIRSLAEDVGEALGCGAHVTALRRLSSGRFDVDEAIDVEALEALPESDRDARILPLSALIADLPRVTLSPAAAAKFAHGLPVAGGVPPTVEDDKQWIAVFTECENAARGEFIGVGRAQASDRGSLVIPVRLLAARDVAPPSI
jgi:tRNA pseudouridine55 synthase